MERKNKLKKIWKSNLITEQKIKYTIHFNIVDKCVSERILSLYFKFCLSFFLLLYEGLMSFNDQYVKILYFSNEKSRKLKGEYKRKQTST